MKTLKTIVFILTITLILQACSNADELTQVNFNTDLTKDINFTTDNSGDFNKTIVIDLTEYGGDIEKYLNKIESIKINTATYKVTAFTGTSNTIGGNFIINSENQDFGSFTHSDFMTDFQTQNTFFINGSEKLNILAAKLKNTKQLQLIISGNSTTSEIYNMTFRINFNIAVTAQAL